MSKSNENYSSISILTEIINSGQLEEIFNEENNNFNINDDFHFNEKEIRICNELDLLIKDLEENLLLQINEIIEGNIDYETEYNQEN